MSYRPSRAERWISAIALRSNVADSRSPGCQPSPASMATSVASEVVGVEVVEAPRGPVAPELGGVHVVELGEAQQLAELREMLRAQLLLDAVGAQAGDR